MASADIKKGTIVRRVSQFVVDRKMSHGFCAFTRYLLIGGLPP